MAIANKKEHILSDYDQAVLRWALKEMKGGVVTQLVFELTVFSEE